MTRVYVLSRVENPEGRPEVAVLSFHHTCDWEALEAEVQRLEHRGYRVLGRLHEAGALGILLSGKGKRVVVSLAPVEFARSVDPPRLALSPPLPA